MSKEVDLQAFELGSDDDERAKPTFQTRDLLAGRFLILHFIAAGGMGEVYAAEDRVLGGRLAIKTLRPELAEDRQGMKRFRREVQLARRIEHPGICRNFEVFYHPLESRDGQPRRLIPFVTMELLEGESLQKRLHARHRMTTAEARPIIRQLIEAVAAAHDKGVVHRDLKSANVMLVPRQEGERAVITDFGLAKLRPRAIPVGEPASSITQTGAWAGTPAYMAPEQLDGSNRISTAVDIYALGVMMYRIVTGRLPFEGQHVLILAMRKISEPVTPPSAYVPNLDPRWERAILRCLEIEPTERFQTPLDILRALDGEPVAPSPRTRQRSETRRLLATGLGATLLVALLGVLLARPRSSVARNGSLPTSTLSTRTIALVAFENLSERPEAAELADLLPAMLAIDLAADGTMAPLRIDNGRRDGPLESDLLLVGYYFATGDGGRVRLDLRVREVSSGEALVSIRVNGTESDLAALVLEAAHSLREALGLPDPGDASGRRARLRLLAAEPGPPR